MTSETVGSDASPVDRTATWDAKPGDAAAPVDRTATWDAKPGDAAHDLHAPWRRRPDDRRLAIPGPSPSQATHTITTSRRRSSCLGESMDAVGRVWSGQRLAVTTREDARLEACERSDRRMR